MLITVLNDGETYTNIEGSHIVAVDDNMSAEDIEEMLAEDNYAAFELGEVKDSNTILNFFRIFFPQMQVEQDSDGQVLIYTGIFE